MRKLLVFAIGVLALGNAAQAALFLRVPEITVTQSASATTGFFDVYLEETAGTQAVVQAYNVGIRLTQGFSTITLTGSSASPAAPAPHPSLFGQAPAATTPSGYTSGKDILLADDYAPGGTATNVAVQNGVKDGLFRLSYNIPANTPIGQYALSVDTNPARLGLFDADANDVAFTIDNGFIQVNAVPEPGSLALALFAVPLLARRRR